MTRKFDLFENLFHLTQQSHSSGKDATIMKRREAASAGVGELVLLITSWLGFLVDRHLICT